MTSNRSSTTLFKISFKIFENPDKAFYLWNTKNKNHKFHLKKFTLWHLIQEES